MHDGQKKSLSVIQIRFNLNTLLHAKSTTITNMNGERASHHKHTHTHSKQNITPTANSKEYTSLELN